MKMWDISLILKQIEREMAESLKKNGGIYMINVLVNERKTWF